MDACRVTYAGVAKETRVFRVDSLVFWDFVATLYVFLRDLTHKPLRLTNPYLDLTVQKHLEKKIPHQEDIMKTIALSLLILFMAVTANAKSWDEHMEDVQTGYASNYGLGPNNGTSYGGGAPQGEWRSQGYGQDSGWDYEGMARQQQRGAERSFWQSQRYDPLRNMKPIAPCGPYYAPRAAKNCY